MSRVIAGMTMSLDGFVADREGGVGALYRDFDAMHESDAIAAAAEETGAVLMGRTTFEMADDPDSFADTYEFQVPIVVVTHEPPAVHPKENDRLTFTFVTDGIEPALAIATEAAGDKAVTVVGGVEVIRQLLRAGMVDELHIDIAPPLPRRGASPLRRSVAGADRNRADRLPADRRARQPEISRWGGPASALLIPQGAGSGRPAGRIRDATLRNR